MFASRIFKKIPFSLLLLATPALATKSSYDQAPPSFQHNDGLAVPIDISHVHIDYSFNGRTRIASARATINFSMREAGYPLFDLVPEIKSVVFNGSVLDSNAIELISDPANVTKMRVLEKIAGPGAEHTLELAYDLRASDVEISQGRVRAGFFMSDLASSGREFFEQYGPANFEYDQVRYTFRVEVVESDIEHVVYTNGELVQADFNTWQIEFPDYFTASSVYFHISEVGRFSEDTFNYDSESKKIPVTVYASTSRLVQDGARMTRKVLAELESTYGPYAHSNVVIFVTPSGGGMEYGGATMTSLWALEHEVTHFWFARGVMPANGNAGWIDEAVASWRDDGYQRASSLPNRSPVNLGGFPIFRKHTTRDAYSLGNRLIGEFDFLLRGQGGMKSMLKQLFETFALQTITVPGLQDFLKERSGEHDQIDRLFNRYVYGHSNVADTENKGVIDSYSLRGNSHPRPYTKAEIALFR